MCFTIATDAVCCAGATICQCACCCCKSVCGSTFKEQIKVAYIVLNIACMLFTVFCLYWIQGLFQDYINFINCPPESGGDHLCLGISAVYRMSFVLATMYLGLLFIMCIRGEMAKAANEGFWALKFVYIAGFFFGSLYIPNSFFEWYVDFARFISGLYLLFQIVMLIDVFYLWGQNWIQKYEAGVEIMAAVLIGTSILLYAAAFILLVFNFIWYNGCGENVFSNVFTLFIIIGITAVQLLGWNPAGSLICSGSLAIYITYQVFTAQASNPTRSCNKLYMNSGVMSTEIVVGFVMNIIALLYLTFASKEDSSKVLKVGGGADATSAFLQSKEEKAKDKAEDEKHDQDDEENKPPPEQVALTQDQKLQEARALIKEAELAPYETNQYIIFHTIMFITVVYMSMMITNWGAPSLNSTTIQGFDQPSPISYWIKTVTSWFAALIYVWTLVAPRLFPDRDFS